MDQRPEQICEGEVDSDPSSTSVNVGVRSATTVIPGTNHLGVRPNDYPTPVIRIYERVYTRTGLGSFFVYKIRVSLSYILPSPRETNEP